jgi:hypothetical protein
MKTSELIGPALDWAVAKCEGDRRFLTTRKEFGQVKPVRVVPQYSTDWSQGGPIIEREKLNVSMSLTAPWMAFIYDEVEMIWLMDGETPLIAAMRCYVASKLGDDVDIPDELA